MWYRTTLIISFGLSLGIASASYLSVNNRKTASIGTRRDWIPAPIGKHLALFKTEIIALSEIPENEVEELTLQGKIFINQPLQGDVNYTWRLPDDVEIVQGKMSDQLAGFQQGQLLESKIVVKGFSKKTQKLISLKASSRSGDLPIGSSAIIVSRPEDTFEYTAAEMKKSADEQLKPSAPKTRR